MIALGRCRTVGGYIDDKEEQRNGSQLNRIEALVRPVPYGMPTGWVTK
jgi:hypothetical protein